MYYWLCAQCLVDGKRQGCDSAPIVSSSHWLHGCNFLISKHAPTWEQWPTPPPPQLIFAVYYVPYCNSRNILYSIIVRSRIQAAHCFTMTTKHNARQALNLIHPQNNFMIKIAGWDCTHSCIYKDFNQHSSCKTEIQRCDCSTWCIRDRFTPLRSYTYQNTVAVGECAGLTFLGLTGYAELPKPVLKIVTPLLIYIHQSESWMRYSHAIWLNCQVYFKAVQIPC